MNKRKIYLLIFIFTATIVFTLELFILRGNIEISNSIDIGLLEIHFYSICILSAVLSFIFLLDKYKNKIQGLKKIDIEEVVFFCMVPGIIGARLWHVIIDWHLYQDNLLSVLYIWNGGLGVLGGLMGIIIGVYIFSKWRKVNFMDLVNLGALFIPLAQIIVRYGNFFNQEIFGPPTSLPWGMFIKEENRPQIFKDFEYFHPAFLYEQIGNLLLLLVNYYLYRKFKFSNHLYIGTYLIGYGSIRFIVEFFRMDPVIAVGLSFHQIVSVFMVLGGLVYFFINRLYDK